MVSNDSCLLAAGLGARPVRSASRLDLCDHRLGVLVEAAAIREVVAGLFQVDRVLQLFDSTKCFSQLVHVPRYHHGA